MRARQTLLAMAVAAAHVATGAVAPAGPPRHPALASHDGAHCISCHGRLLRGSTTHPPASLGCPGCHLVAATGDGTLLALPEDDPALCLACHEGVLDTGPGPRGRGHGCLACHDPHASAHPRLLRQSSGALCDACHERPLLSRVHATLQATGRPCTSCHAPHATVARPVPGDLATWPEPPPGPVAVRRDEPPPAPSGAIPVLPAPSTAPTPRPSPTPRTPGPTPAERLGWSDARALLRANRLTEAARAFSILVATDPRPYSILLLVACETSTVERAVASVPGDELFVVPRSFQGRSCFALRWGLYASAAEAREALGKVPRYFRDWGATPAIVGTLKLAR